jgi:hypothetical protein
MQALPVGRPPVEDRAAGATVYRDAAWARWQEQPWRHQLRRPEDYLRRLDRATLVRRLMREGMAPAAELACLAAGIATHSSTEHLTIQQVVNFAESRMENVATASPEERVRATYLQRCAVDLANRMIDWVNAGRL